MADVLVMTKTPKQTSFRPDSKDLDTSFKSHRTLMFSATQRTYRILKGFLVAASFFQSVSLDPNGSTNGHQCDFDDYTLSGLTSLFRSRTMRHLYTFADGERPMPLFLFLPARVKKQILRVTILDNACSFFNGDIMKRDWVSRLLISIAFDSLTTNWVRVPLAILLLGAFLECFSSDCLNSVMFAPVFNCNRSTQEIISFSEHFYSASLPTPRKGYNPHIYLLLLTKI